MNSQQQPSPGDSPETTETTETTETADAALDDAALAARLERLAPVASVQEGLHRFRSARRRHRRCRAIRYGMGAAVGLVISAAAISLLQRPDAQKVITASPTTVADNTSTDTTGGADAQPTAATRAPLTAPVVDGTACPQFTPGPMPPVPGGFHVRSEDDAAFQDRVTSQSEAWPTAEVLGTYANDHPDAAFSSGFEWHGSSATAFIALSGDGEEIERHCAAIGKLLPEGAQWVLRWQPYSDAELRQLAAEITAQHGPVAYNFDNGVLTVMLALDKREVADSLLERYSPQVAVVLGFHPYPHLSDGRDQCGTWDLGDFSDTTLHAQMASPMTIRSGMSGTVEVSFTNPTAQPVDVEQPRIALLGNGRRILSTSAPHDGIAVDAMSVRLILLPGESKTLTLSVFTATCDPADGYQLAPGTYQVEIPIESGIVRTGQTITVTS